MLLSKCLVCNSKKQKFLKEKEARGLLNNLTRVKIPVVNDLPLFNAYSKSIKMNAIVKILPLAGNKFMSEMLLKQPGFTYGTFAPFNKNKEEK